MKNQVIITAHNLYSKLPLVVKNIAAKVKAIATAIVKNENTCYLFKSVMSIVYIIDIKKTYNVFFFTPSFLSARLVETDTAIAPSTNVANNSKN